jgi:hypothetical protein
MSVLKQIATTSTPCSYSPKADAEVTLRLTVGQSVRLGVEPTVRLTT